MYYYTPLLIEGIGLAAFVWYYTRDDQKNEVVQQQVSKPKKSNLEI